MFLTSPCQSSLRHNFLRSASGKMKTMRTFVVLFVYAASVLAEESPVVDTTSGKLRGYTMTSRGGRQFLAFSGVPFAKSPVGERRFEPPSEPERWSGIRNATQAGPLCLQYNSYDLEPKPVGSEDCLYLSVYTHRKRSKNAVLVHYHGGGFNSGDGPSQSQPDYMMDKDVVVVDVNYRVGFLGFLGFEDNEMPGNQGLKDQVMALKWVQKNIAKFGGDPNRVTIVGESAGAGSVYHHTVSPLTNGLFHRAIAESGSSYSGWSLAPPGRCLSQARKMAKELGCPGDNTTQVVSCLKTKNGSDITSVVESFRGWQIDFDIVWPCLEPEGPGSFLVGPVSSWEHKPVPLMLGTTSGEGLLRTGYIAYFNITYDWLNDNFDRVAPLSLMYGFTSTKPDQITKELKSYYFPPKGEITEDKWRNLTQLYTDSWFAIGALDGANKHTGDTFYYYFDYIGEFTFDEGTNMTIYFGAPHTEEINFIWKNPLRGNKTLTGEDLKFSRRLVKIWTDFAKFGNPAPRGSEISWSKWNPKKHNYLEMSKSGFRQKEGFLKETYNFWKTLKYRDAFQ